MARGLFKKLALAAPLVVCLPFCALGADGSASDEDAPKIFEEFSLTSATTEMTGGCAPAQMAAPQAPCGSSGACCNSGACCDEKGCCDGCFSDHCCSQFFAGVDATFFHASTHGMHADASVTTFRQDNGTENLANDEVFDRWTASPRIFAGVQQDCWGLLGRFWYLSDSSSTLNPFFPPPGNGLGLYSNERIKAYTADFEISRAFCYCGNKLNFYFGGRYASFESGQAIDFTRLTGPTEIAYSNVFTAFSFNGIGVTTGFQGRTPIGCDTCISLVYGLRGSVLWGNANRAVQTSATIVDTGVAGSAANSAQADNCDTAFIVEGLLGFQWDHELRCLPMSAYLRIAAEAQYWDLGDNGTANAVSVGTLGSGAVSARGSVEDVNALLVGFSVGAGFNW